MLKQDHEHETYMHQHPSPFVIYKSIKCMKLDCVNTIILDFQLFIISIILDLNMIIKVYDVLNQI